VVNKETRTVCIRLTAFAATETDKILLGNEPRQLGAEEWRHPSLMIKAETPWNFFFCSELKQLIAPADFIRDNLYS
jgi:hypothetical protein